jgi:hypothetical protein
MKMIKLAPLGKVNIMGQERRKIKDAPSRIQMMLNSYTSVAQNMPVA